MSISRTTPRRASRDQRREELAARILDGLPAVLAEGATFASASVERLTAAAGVGRSTFYLYFQDKTELLTTWFAPIADELGTLEEAWRRLDPELAPAVLRGILTEVIHIHQRHELALSVILAAADYDPQIRSVVNAASERTISALAKRLRRGQRDGWIGAAVSVRETAVWLVLMTSRGAMEMTAVPESERAVLLDSYVEVLRAALRGSSRA